MVNRYFIAVFLAGLLAACGAQAVTDTPQPGGELLDHIVIPSGWVVGNIKELEQDDIPANAYTGLQEAFRAQMVDPDQSLDVPAAARIFILLYEDTTTAHNAYLQIKDYRITEGAETDQMDSDLPYEEITFALTNRDATSISYNQSTIVSCRAVLRYDWVISYDAPFTVYQLIDTVMTSARKIRRTTCDEERMELESHSS